MGRDVHAVVALVCGEAEVASWALAGEGRPDLAVLDELARLRLAAGRLRCSIQVRNPSDDLRALLELAGLDEVLTERVAEG